MAFWDINPDIEDMESQRRIFEEAPVFTASQTVASNKAAEQKEAKQLKSSGGSNSFFGGPLDLRAESTKSAEKTAPKAAKSAVEAINLNRATGGISGQNSFQVAPDKIPDKLPKVAPAKAGSMTTMKIKTEGPNYSRQAEDYMNAQKAFLIQDPKIFTQVQTDYKNLRGDIERYRAAADADADWREDNKFILAFAEQFSGGAVATPTQSHLKKMTDRVQSADMLYKASLQRRSDWSSSYASLQTLQSQALVLKEKKYADAMAGQLLEHAPALQEMGITIDSEESLKFLMGRANSGDPQATKAINVLISEEYGFQKQSISTSDTPFSLATANTRDFQPGTPASVKGQEFLANISAAVSEGDIAKFLGKRYSQEVKEAYGRNLTLGAQSTDVEVQTKVQNEIGVAFLKMLREDPNMAYKYSMAGPNLIGYMEGAQIPNDGMTAAILAEVEDNISKTGTEKSFTNYVSETFKTFGTNIKKAEKPREFAEGASLDIWRLIQESQSSVEDTGIVVMDNSAMFQKLTVANGIELDTNLNDRFEILQSLMTYVRGE